MKKIVWTAIENIRDAAKYLEKVANEIEADPVLRGFVINVNLKWFPSMTKNGLYRETYFDVSSNRDKDTRVCYCDIKNVTIDESNAMNGKEN